MDRTTENRVNHKPEYTVAVRVPGRPSRIPREKKSAAEERVDNAAWIATLRALSSGRQSGATWPHGRERLKALLVTQSLFEGQYLDMVPETPKGNMVPEAPKGNNI